MVMMMVLAMLAFGFPSGVIAVGGNWLIDYHENNPFAISAAMEFFFTRFYRFNVTYDHFITDHIRPKHILHFNFVFRI